MPNAAFASGFINSFIDSQTQQRQRKEQNARDTINFLVSTGRLRNYDDLKPYLQTMFPQLGEKPKGAKGGQGQPQDPNQVLKQFVDPMFQLMQSNGGQGVGGGAQNGPGVVGAMAQNRPAPQPAAAPTSMFLSDEELQQRATAGEQTKSDITEGRETRLEGVRHGDAMELEGARESARLAAEQARRKGGVADKQATQDPDGAWTIKVRDKDTGEVIYKQQANAPKVAKETGPLAERKKELIAMGVPEDRAESVAATQLAKERQTKQQQSGARLGAYLSMSRQALLTSTERYNEMKQNFPYTLAAKMSGAEVAGLRPEIVQQQLAKGRAALAKPTPADRDGQKEASKIVEAATKAAATMAGKQSKVLEGLGIDDDEATIRRNLIQEMSGGADPAAVEALAHTRLTAPATAAKPSALPPTTITTPRGAWTVAPAQ